jgi:hypothetical protein
LIAIGIIGKDAACTTDRRVRWRGRVGRRGRWRIRSLLVSCTRVGAVVALALTLRLALHRMRLRVGHRDLRVVLRLVLHHFCVDERLPVLD